MSSSSSNPSRVQSISESSQPIRQSRRLNQDHTTYSPTTSLNEVGDVFDSGATSSSKAQLITDSLNTRLTSTRRHSSRYRSHRPAELYRTDFITAMKIPDHEVLTDFKIITDQWKLEYENAIQVPTKDIINAPNICYNPYRPKLNPSQDLTPIPHKLLCPLEDKNFNPEVNEPYITHPYSTSKYQSNYDYDEVDANWLERINELLNKLGVESLSVDKFEKLIELFEAHSNKNLNQFLENLKSYNIEFDEAIVCDVCRSPDSECANEMVFCDGCNVCVHQACYGIEKVPSGPWLCGPCEFGGIKFKPDCMLCPNKGGALKPTRNSRSWCHVSCALWIPDVGFGNPLKLEPITNTSRICPARWRLVCSLCQEKVGCCVQCSEKKCPTPFHITCAFKHNLLVEQKMGDDEQVLFTCFCREHSRRMNLKNGKVLKGVGPLERDCEPLVVSDELAESVEMSSEEDGDYEYGKNERKFLVSLQSMTETDRKFAIIYRLKKMYSRFYQNIDLDEIKSSVDLEDDKIVVKLVFNYWKLKRRHNIPENKALIYPRNVDDLVSQTENVLLMRKNMFMHLRHDLERLRNLSYLVVKREKLKRSYFELDRECFQKQVEYLSKYKANTDYQYHSEAEACTTRIQLQPVQPSTSSNHRATNFRIRDLLRFKNEKNIYDFPDKWTEISDLKASNNPETDSKMMSAQNASKRILKKYDSIKTRNLNQNKMCQTPDWPENEEDPAAASPEFILQKSPRPNIKDIPINILNNKQPMKENRRLLRRDSSKSSVYSSQSRSVDTTLEVDQNDQINNKPDNNKHFSIKTGIRKKKHLLRSTTMRLRQIHVNNSVNEVKKYNYRITRFRMSQTF